MAEIKLNHGEVLSLALKMTTSGNSLKSSSASVPSVSTCQGIMLSTYVDRIRKISKLLEDYKKLLQEDTKDIVKSCNTIVQTDTNIGKSI